MIVPEQVYDELAVISRFKRSIDDMLKQKIIMVEHIDSGTKEDKLYLTLIMGAPPLRRVAIGKGESSSITLAKFDRGIVASNNLKDILFYIKKFHLSYLTTGDIMVNAYYKNYIDEGQGNAIWSEMLSNNRKIGANTFTVFLKQNKNKTL